jgi:hypothetical protein
MAAAGERTHKPQMVKTRSIAICYAKKIITGPHVRLIYRESGSKRHQGNHEMAIGGERAAIQKHHQATHKPQMVKKCSIAI